MIAAITLNVSIDRRYVVENAPLGAVNRVKECVYTAGGKGLNVARVVHTLGEPVIAGGIVGGDAGRYILRNLDREGIRHHFSEAAGESRSCINIYDTATGVQTEFLEPGLTVQADEYEAFLRTFDELCDTCRVITMSGSLPKGLSSNTYADLIRRASAKGIKVLLDSSGASLRDALAAQPFYIKPNEDEIAALTGCDAGNDEEVFSAALQLQQSGIDRVVVSMGKKGAVMACSKGLLRAQPPEIKAVNTVGCGDSMTAAFAVAEVRGLDEQEALRFAVATSAASALNPGTGGLEPADLQRILPEVKVWKV